MISTSHPCAFNLFGVPICRVRMHSAPLCVESMVVNGEREDADEVERRDCGWPQCFTPTPSVGSALPSYALRPANVSAPVE